MKVVFYLKGAVRVDWTVPDPTQFSFQLMVKMIRADGQFLADGIYLQANEIAAILVEEDHEVKAQATIRHKAPVTRLSS